jgi:predicted branched-subunit amino acid permease
MPPDYSQRQSSIAGRVDCAGARAVGQHGWQPDQAMSSAASSEIPQPSSAAVFLDGMLASFRSVFALVLTGTYVGIGALAHDYGFSLAWVMLSTVLIWAAPAQVIMISALGAGAALLEVALAVFLSAVRFLPMVVSLLPLLRGPHTRPRDLLIPVHFTAASMWVESFRLLPPLPRERRIPFCNGLAIGFMLSAHIGTVIGFYLAALLPALLTAALLFLTPMSFLVSTARNSATLANRLALALGLVVSALLVYFQIGLDLMWTGLIAGSLAYAAHRLRGALQ